MSCAHMLAFALALAATGADSAGSPPPEAERTTEWRAVEAAVEAYVAAFYELDPERIRRHVDPEVSNVGFVPAQDGGGYQQVSLDFPEIVESAATTNKEGIFPEDPLLEVTVFEVLDQTASAKVVAEWGVDFMHLAKIDGEWKIIHVLWQTRPR